MFSHGAAIGEILAQATGSEPFAFLGADNASISKIVVHDGALGAARLQRHGAPDGLSLAPP